MQNENEEISERGECMNCPNCNGKNRVIDSVTTDKSVIRRRKCLDCEQLFYTEEMCHDNDELKSAFWKIKHGKYEKKPVTTEVLKRRLIKRMMGK